MSVKVIPELFTNDIPDDLANNEARNRNQPIPGFGKITPHQSLFPHISSTSQPPNSNINTPAPHKWLFSDALGLKKTQANFHMQCRFFLRERGEIEEKNPFRIQSCVFLLHIPGVNLPHFREHMRTSGLGCGDRQWWQSTSRSAGETEFWSILLRFNLTCFPTGGGGSKQ